jgi:hypothetical protein
MKALTGLTAAVWAILGLAACGSTTSAPTATVSATPTAQPGGSAVTNPIAATNLCPATFTGQKVSLTGTIVTSLAIGGNFFSVVKDGNGQTCQLVTSTNPGATGATITVTDFVAYVSPGTPPISRIASAAYAANDR